MSVFLFTVFQAAGYGIVYFAKKMLEDKGISLEGKRCLITGSDSVSTLLCCTCVPSYFTFCCYFLFCCGVVCFVSQFFSFLSSSFLSPLSSYLLFSSFLSFSLFTFFSNPFLSLPLVQTLSFLFLPCRLL